MDMRFDAHAAEQLIRQMDIYCLEIVKETQKLRSIANDSNAWNDKQQNAFQVNVEEMAKDLNNALVFEGEYMLTFRKRVQELRGK